MKRIAAVILLLLGSLFALPFSTHPAHASPGTGLVCLTRATSNNCPQVPLTFNATAIGKTFTVGVFVNNSDAMGGFDIFVQDDQSFLNPVSAALGPLIASPSLTSICINGLPQVGACTTGSANGPGVVEVTTLESSGGNECGGISPCSGMAFTITYSVVGTTSSTPLSYPTNAGCANSSVASPPNVCVLVADAGGTPLPETTLGGDFTDQTPTANFGASPTTGNAPLTVAFDATTSNATLGHTITFYNWTFGDGVKMNVTSATISHIYNAANTYSPTLVTQDSSGSKSSIKGGLTITVFMPDFSINGNTTSLSIIPGKNKNVTIVLTSSHGFSGPITLSANSSVILGITSTLNKTSVNLGAGQTDTSAKLTVATSVLTSPGTYHVNVTGVSGTLKHSLFITIAVVQMQYSLSSSGPITAIRGQSGTNMIIATLATGTGQPVTLSCVASSLPAGASCSFNPASVTPASTGSSSVLTITTTTSTPGGSHTITVTGTPQPTTNATFALAVADFQISGNPPSVSVPQGGNGNSIIILTGQSGFNGNINLTATSGSGNIIGFLNRTTVRVTPTGGSNSSTLYIIAQTGTAPGSYNIVVTGKVGLLTHSFTVTVDVPVPNFGASATPTSVSVKTGTNGTSVLSLIGLNGFTGTINLQARDPTGLGITSVFSSTSITITSTSGPVASTLTISTSTTTAAGTYTVIVNATTSSLYHLVNITLIVVSPIPSIQLGSATLSTVSVTAGKTVDMTVTVSNTGTIPVNVTITMDVNGGSGANVTVAQTTVTLTPGTSAQSIKLSWDTTQWAGGTYHVYARIIGSQSTAVNQAQSAGTVALSSPPSSPPPADLSIIPWISTAILAAIAVVLGLLLFRRRRPTGPPESA
jgi:PKD repeat protein